MTICPHCRGELDAAKQYITCPHCGLTTSSVDDCVKVILSSGQLENLTQKANNEYWQIITTGLRHIRIMDMETCLEVCDRLFKSPEGHSSHGRITEGLLTKCAQQSFYLHITVISRRNSSGENM